MIETDNHVSPWGIGDRDCHRPDLHEVLLLMRATGISRDRMHLDDDWEFPEHMKELVP